MTGDIRKSFPLHVILKTSKGNQKSTGNKRSITCLPPFSMSFRYLPSGVLYIEQTSTYRAPSECYFSARKNRLQVNCLWGEVQSLTHSYEHGGMNVWRPPCTPTFLIYKISWSEWVREFSARDSEKHLLSPQLILKEETNVTHMNGVKKKRHFIGRCVLLEKQNLLKLHFSLVSRPCMQI